MKNIVIIGAGSLGKEALWLIEDINKEYPTYVVLGFLDDNNVKALTDFCGYKVLGKTDMLEELSGKFHAYAVLAIQDYKSKKRIVEEHSDFQNWENLIHPTAVIAPSTSYGKGNMFFPQSVISVDTIIGNFCLFSIHSSVANDCLISDYAAVMQGAAVSDHVTIKSNCLIKDHDYIPANTIVDNTSNVIVDSNQSEKGNHD